MYPDQVRKSSGETLQLLATNQKISPQWSHRQFLIMFLLIIYQWDPIEYVWLVLLTHIAPPQDFKTCQFNFRSTSCTWSGKIHLVPADDVTLTAPEIRHSMQSTDNCWSSRSPQMTNWKEAPACRNSVSIYDTINVGGLDAIRCRVPLRCSQSVFGLANEKNGKTRRNGFW